jgi:hypothetical protein
MMTDPTQDVLQGISHPADEEQARSLLDLIELNTFDLELAAWCVSLVARGASYITGSGPGGIGKTTTMHSLLSFVPNDLAFQIALPGEVSQVGDGRHCVISNELSDHTPPTYLWDQDLRDFFTLSAKGHVLVANVHADDLDEIHGQLVGECEVPEAQFRAVNLLIFICLEGGNPPGERRITDNTTRRVVNKIFYTDGTSPHQSVYDPASGLTPAAPRDPEHEGRCRAFLEQALNGSERSIVDVRRRFLAWGG